MKKVLLSLLLVGFAAMPDNALAQRYDPRIDVPGTIAQPAPRDYRPNRDERAGSDLDELNRDVRRTRLQIRASGGGGRRIRNHFDRAVRATEQLKVALRRGTLNPREARSRAQRIQSDLHQIQQELRSRR